MSNVCSYEVDEAWGGAEERGQQIWRPAASGDHGRWGPGRPAGSPRRPGAKPGHLRLVGEGPPVLRAARTEATVVPLGQPAGAPHKVSVRALRNVALGLVALGLVVALALPLQATGGRVAPSAHPAAVLAAGQRYTVHPGDSLWSIATRMDPGGNTAAVVAQLARQLGSTTVVPGEHIQLP